MRLSDIIREAAGFTAEPFEHLDPITRRPMVSYRIHRDGELVGQTLGRYARTPEEAIERFVSQKAWEAEVAARPPVERPKPKRVREPRPDVRVWIVPPKDRDAIESWDDPDQFLYHVTSWPRARQIIRQGLLTGQSPTFSNYGGHSQGRIFFTERGGVPYWTEKVEMHLEYNTDGRPPPAAVLRVRREDVLDLLKPDPIGTKDAGEPAYYIEQDFK